MTAKEFQYKLINLQESLMRFAYSLTIDIDDAKDLVQETFLKALTYRDKFVHESNFRAWTYTIMKNTFINNYRRSALHNTYSDHTKEEFCMNCSHTLAIDNPHSAYTSKELEKTVDALDDHFKLPFKMHHEGYKYKEIAETLELNLGTVKSRIFFAKQKLMKQLNGCV